MVPGIEPTTHSNLIFALTFHISVFSSRVVSEAVHQCLFEATVDLIKLTYLLVQNIDLCSLETPVDS